MIMAAGTGGHIYPGLTIACALHKKNIRALWLGADQKGLENRIVSQYDIPIFYLNIQGFRGKNFFKKIKIMINFFKAVYQAYHILKQQQPDRVLGMGGYVSLPGGIAARLLGIPLFIHEQNSIAGLSNKILSHLACKVFYAFPHTFPAHKKMILTGNPIREEILQISAKSYLHQPARLLIIGGSLGAKIFNDIIPPAIELLPAHLRPDIYHQTGRQSSAIYNISIKATVTEFINDIEKKYAWADIIICRAGALTLAEITAIGLPALLIPYPYAVDDHQTLNAKYLENNNASVLLNQSELNPEKLCETLKAFLDPEKYAEKATAARLLRRENTLDLIIQALL